MRIRLPGRLKSIAAKLSRAAAAMLCAVLLCACAGRVDTQTIRSSIASGHTSALLEEMRETHASYEEFATALNLARVYQLEGQWELSRSAFAEALGLLEEYEGRALLSIRDVAADAGTILLARGSRSYYGTGYERSLLHTFNALNYVMLGDFSGAAVEMRKMELRQERWLQESQARLEENIRQTHRGDSPAELPAQYSMRDILNDPAVKDVANSYQDAFSYSLSAILCRLANDPEYARVSLRRAEALDDAAKALFRNAWGEPRGAKTVERLPALPDAAAASQELTVIAFSGLVPALRVEHIRIPFPIIGYLLLDLPSYMPAVPGDAPTARASSGSELALHPLLHADLLAYRTLRDEASLEMASAVSRAFIRAGISGAAVAATASSRHRNLSLLAGHMTTLLVDLVTTPFSQSVRNWETLPNTGYLAQASVRRGTGVTIALHGEEVTIPLPQHARGVIILANQLSDSQLRVYHVAY